MDTEKTLNLPVDITRSSRAAPSPSSRHWAALSGYCRGGGGDVYRARHSVRELYHPITILSTLPTAGVGALLAL